MSASSKSKRLSASKDLFSCFSRGPLGLRRGTVCRWWFIPVVAVPNQRRTHFEAMAESCNLAGRFLRQQVSTHLSDNVARLKRAAKQAQSLNGKARKHILERLNLLERCRRNGRKVLPLLLGSLGGAPSGRKPEANASVPRHNRW